MRALIIALPVFLILAVSAKLAFDAMRVADPTDPNYHKVLLEQDLALVEGRCSEPEGLDRRLLQQTWFASQAHQDIAMVFGQSSFSMYDGAESSKLSVEGAFCIEGNTLQVRYFETTFVPTEIGFGEIRFGRTVRPLQEGSIQITKIDRNEMSFVRDKDVERTVFRKD